VGSPLGASQVSFGSQEVVGVEPPHRTRAVRVSRRGERLEGFMPLVQPGHPFDQTYL
jgi:hypothetical protein